MPTRLRRISRRLRRSALLNYAAATVVVCALLLLTAFVAVGSYRDAQATARTQVANLSRVLAEQTYGLFKSVDLTLRNIAAERPETLRRFDPEFQAQLRRQVDDLAFVRALYSSTPPATSSRTATSRRVSNSANGSTSAPSSPTPGSRCSSGPRS
jgi:hypothetical protein